MSTALPAGVTPGTYVIDASHSEASFNVRHAGIAKVKGRVAITSGTLTIDEDLTKSSVTAELDANSIDTRDENRDNHLRSADFFEVEKFPTWNFTSTAVAADGDDYTITGD